MSAAKANSTHAKAPSAACEAICRSAGSPERAAQIGITIWFFLLANILAYWLDVAASLTTLLARRKHSSSSSLIHTLHAQLAATLDDLRSSRPATALFSSLVEFQETQVFFVLSIQIATFVSYRPRSQDPGVLADARAAALEKKDRVLEQYRRRVRELEESHPHHHHHRHHGTFVIDD